MVAKSSWKALQRRLAAGVVLRHVIGVTKPIVAGRACQFHEHKEIELVFHPTGRGVTTMQGGQSVAFAEGDVVLYAPGVRHDQRAEVSGMDCCVQLEAPRGLALAGHLHVGKIEDMVLWAELEFLSSRLPGASATGDALLNLRTTAVMVQLLDLAFARTAVRAGNAERHVLAAERYSQENYARIESVSEVARAVGIGPDYLRHLFKRHRGQSLVAYVNDVRRARARTLLTHTDLPIKEIAARCGYRDEYYFSTVFRKGVGCAPGRYRERTLAGAQAIGRVS